MSAGLNLNLWSVTSTLASVAVSSSNGQYGSAFASSANLINLDITFVTGGSRGSSQTRGQLLDFNADKCPDYLLYDSVGHPAGPDGMAKAGGLLLYQNDCKGSFLEPVRINDGYPLSQNEHKVEYVRQEVELIPNEPSSLVTAWLKCSLDSPYPALPTRGLLAATSKDWAGRLRSISRMLHLKLRICWNKVATPCPPKKGTKRYPTPLFFSSIWRCSLLCPYPIRFLA